MNLSFTPVKHAKIGTCPHGLPAGACPICSGAGGGGGGAKKASGGAKEMSWDECFAVGQMMKAQKLAHQAKNEQNIPIPISFGATMTNFAQRISDLAPKITEFSKKITESMPAIISKPIAFIANKVLIPMLNVIKDIALNIQKTVSFVKEKFVEISDKLNAMFGELKNSIEKKISDGLKDFKKKIKSLFGVFEPREDEENKLEEVKRNFELKTVLNFIKEKFTNQKNKDEKYYAD